jgi:hypothetical protein
VGSIPTCGSDKREGQPVDYASATIHIFLSVLIWGTLWRLTTYHLMASQQANLNHVGKAMSIQF